MTNFGDLRYTAWGGGVPILYEGQVIGAVGISGLAEAEDVELARKGPSLSFQRNRSNYAAAEISSQGYSQIFAMES